MTEEQIDALLDDVDNDVFSPRDRAVLRLAEQMDVTNTHGYVSDELHADLSAHFSDAEIFELGMTMAVLCGVAKFIFCFDLVTREESCPVRRPA